MAKQVHLVTEEKEFDNKLFFTIEEMSLISGLGAAFLRSLIDNKDIDYIPIGTKKMLRKSAVIDWYKRNKINAITEV